MADLPPTKKVGISVIWRHELRGGYGYVERIPATVEKIGPKRVLITVRKRSGEVAARWVSPASLEERSA